MESKIGVNDSVEIITTGGSFHLPDDLVQFSELGLTDDLKGLTEAKTFECQAQRHEDLNLLVGDANHRRTPVWSGSDKSLILKLPECLSNGSSTRVEVVSDLSLYQPLARLQASGNNPLTQDVRDPVATGSSGVFRLLFVATAHVGDIVSGDPGKEPSMVFA